jgi:hypothetical protein
MWLIGVDVLYRFILNVTHRRQKDNTYINWIHNESHF